MKHKLLLLLSSLLLSACVSTGSAGLVAVVASEGVGTVRTDIAHVVAIGRVSGFASVFVKGVGLPVVIPYTVDEGEAFLWTRATGFERRPLSSPLPAWVKDLFLPDELAALELELGFALTFE